MRKIGLFVFGVSLIIGVAFLQYASRSGRGTAISKFQKDELPITHVMVLVFDQMRPDYIDRFNLPHFKQLRERGSSFAAAVVGHLPSITILSHPVLATGLFPRNLPWMDHLLVRGPAGREEVVELSNKDPDDFLALMADIPQERYLATQIRTNRNGKVYAVGAKQYAATTFGGPAADGIVTLRNDGDVCRPSGKQVPSYIRDNDRFTLACGASAGPLLTPFGGTKHVPGDDAAHQGGDVWVTDVAREIMEHEKWSGLLLTFSGIDKAGHLLGTPDARRRFEGEVRYSLEDIVRIADAQLGRILSELAARELLATTLIAVTADHGAQTNERPLGSGGNAYLRGAATPSDGFAPLIRSLSEVSDVVAIAADTSVRIWMTPESPMATNVQAILQREPELLALYKLERWRDSHEGPEEWRYQQVFARQEDISAGEREWGKRMDSPLLATLAAPRAPTFVALLRDDAGYGPIGDHGGAQQKVQRIPMLLAGPGVPAGIVDNRPIGLKEFHDEIVARLALPPTP